MGTTENPSLLICYKCNGGLVNSISSNYNPTVTGDCLINKDNRFGQPVHALRYAGDTGHSVTIPLELTNGDAFSLAVWIYRDPEQLITAQNNFLFGDDISGTDLKIYVDSTFHVCATNGSCNITSVSTLPVGWTRVAYSVGGSYLNYFQNIYFNGELDIHTTHTYIEPWYVYPVHMFQAADESSGENDFQFTFDDFKYYNRVLTDDEMNQEYHYTFKTYIPTIRSYLFRCVVEHNGSLYYPDMIMAQTNQTFQWSCPTAAIEIITNNNISDSNYMGALREDDIIRIQVAYRTNDSQAIVYQDIFEGRIYGMSVSMSNANNTTLLCRGHSEELLYRVISSDKSYISDTGAIITDMLNSFTSRVTVGDNLIQTGTRTLVYNAVANTKYVGDIIKDMESTDLYTNVFSTKPIYNSSGLLTATYAVWKPIGGRTIYITEDTKTFISGTFTSSSQQKFDNIKVFGSGSYAATATSGTGARTKIIVDKTLNSSTACQEVANAALDHYENSQVTGGLLLLGNPNISVGDYVACNIPSIILNGSAIDGVYTVRRVSHNISSAGYITSLDVGEIMLEVSEIIAAQATKIRLLEGGLI